MRKALLIAVLIFIGIQKGCDYLFSEKFQQWSDKHQVPWTCQVNLVLAEFRIIFSRYADAIALYERVIKRCPKTHQAENAAYKIAFCWESQGNVGHTLGLYQEFVENYPESKWTVVANKKISVLEMRR